MAAGTRAERALGHAIGGLTALQLLGLVLAVAAALGLAYLVSSQVIFTGARPPVPQTATVQRATIAATVGTSGSVVSTRTAKLSFLAGGRVGEMLVGTGDRVIAGQLLARLEEDALRIKLDQARSNLRTAELKLRQLEEGSTAEEIQAAQAAFQAAQVKLAETRAGPTSADLRAAESAISSALATHEGAVAKLSSLEAGPTEADTSAALSTVQSAEANLRGAQARLEQVLAGPTDEDVFAAQKAVEAAQASLASAQSKLDQLRAGPTRADLEAAEAAVSQAAGNLWLATEKWNQLQGGATTAEERRAASAALAAANAALRVAEKNLADEKAGDNDYNKVLSLESSLAAAISSVQAAEQKLKDLDRKPTDADVAAAKSALDSAQASLDSAVAKLDQLRAGPTPFEIAQAQASIDSSRASLETQQSKLRQLLAGSPVDEAVARVNVEVAESNLTSARAKLEQLLAGPTQDDLRAARAAVESALAGQVSARAKLDLLRAGATRAELAAAESTLASTASQLAAKSQGPREVEIELALEARRQAELSVRQAELDLANTELRAPFDGIVSAVTLNRGEQVSASAAPITLVDPTAIRIDANVDEVDIARIRPDQPVELTFEALPGRRFSGRVLAISPSGVIQQGVVTYPVNVTVDPEDAALPAGLSAAVNIIVERRENVVAAPARAVRRQGRTQTVQVMRQDGTLETRQVRTGTTDGTLVEIVDGVREGDVVALPATTTVAPSPSGGFGPKPGGGFAPGPGGGVHR